MKNILAGAFLLMMSTAVHAAGSVSKDIVVYKNPECGCCNKWINYLKSYNYNVTEKNTRELLSLKKKMGIPEKLASCHTAVIDGYIIEGHVPAETIDNLLAERPDIYGLAVPGMPVGSPGMESPAGEVQPYDVYMFDQGGATGVYASHGY